MKVSNLVPRTLWTKEDVGSNRGSKNEMRAIFPSSSSFDTPKPVKLVERVLEICTIKDSIVLDSFAGSGTTAHAVLNLNKLDGGNRKFILIEMEEYAETVTAERVNRVMKGYGNVEGTGGTFNFYTLGQNLFEDDGNLNENIAIGKIRMYIYYTETSQVLNETRNSNKYYLDRFNDTDYYFYYERDALTTLNYEFLTTMKLKSEQYVIYADNCVLSDKELTKRNIIFKKIPRDITRF